MHVLGSRADAVRLASVHAALERTGAVRQVVVEAVDAVGGGLERVRRDLGLGGPSTKLEATASTPAARTASVVEAFDALIEATGADLVVVSGDSDAALACALVAAKREVAVARLEAGLRSWDWSTPREVNRVVTDRLADTLFTHGAEAGSILRAEGVPDGRIHSVGSTAVDALRRCEATARRRAAWRAFDVEPHEYVLASLHLEETVGDPQRLGEIVEGLEPLVEQGPVLLALHPASVDAELPPLGEIRPVPALGYLDFLSLQLGAGAVVTDSGGVQEETTALGVACFTLRTATERSVTLTHGTNTLLGDDPADLVAVRPARRPPTPCAIPLWDGHAGQRTATTLLAHYTLSRNAGMGG